MQERLVTMDTAGSWRRILTQSNPLQKGEGITLSYDSHNGPNSDVWVTLMTERTNKLFIAKSTGFNSPTAHVPVIPLKIDKREQSTRRASYFITN